MRNDDVYRLAREHWGPWLKDSGFVRTGPHTDHLVKAGLWLRPLVPPVGSANRLVIGVEAHQYGWSPEMGGRFRVVLGAGACACDWPGLTPVQYREMNRINHAVLDRLAPDFEPVATMRWNVDHPTSDRWFHFVDETDVRRSWMPTALAALAGDASIMRLFDRA